MIANINGNTINNLSIDGTGTTSTMYGIQSSTGTISVNNNVISNLTCIKTSGTGVLYGIYNISSPVNENYNGNTIFNLTHNGTGTLYGLYAFTTTGVRTVSDNTIYNLVTGGTTISGIQMSSSSPSIFRNKVYNVRSNSAGAPTVSGIMLTSMGTSGVANIYNNLIGDLTAPNASSSTATAPTLRGINLTTTSTGSVNVSFNTIYLSGSTSGANFATAGLFATTSTTATASELFLRNNIIVNLSQPKGTGNAVAYQRSSTALNNYNNASNNNLFYAGTPGATNLIFFDGTNASQTIDAFKTLVSPRESNSITENPSFLSVVGASSDFLHINPAIPTQIESGGINIAGITTDYDNDIRAGNPGYAGAGVAPDLGADEGDFAVLDLSGPIITYTQLPNACTTGDRTLSGVSIADATGIPTSGSLVPRIYYRKPAGSWFSRPGTFVSGNTNNSIWNFTIVVADIGGLMVGDVVEYYVIAQDVVVPVNISSNPSGAVATDVNTVITHPASPNTFNVVNSLSGTYTVGSGGDFPTLTAALAAYNANCIVGAVTFNLTDATYPSETFPLTIGANSFASEINTLTIKPNSSATIEGTHAGCILALSGADFVTIDGSNSGGTDRSLSIINNSIVTNTAAICVLSLGSNQGATNNTIKNVNILAGEIGSTTTLNTFSVFVASLPISNTATGADNDNLIIENNSIRKARYGIYARGTSVANANDGLMISGNDIGSANQSEYVTFRGIDITNAEAPEIDGNFIFNLKQTLSTSNAAIDFGSGVNNGVISRNVISGIYSESTGGWGAYGINFSSTTSVNNNVISNNFITDIRTVNYSTGSTTFNAFGIRLAGGTNTKVFFNSINLFGDIIIVSGTPTQPNSAPLVVTTTSVTGLQVKNNIFRNVQTFISGSPKTYSIWFPTSYTGYTLMDNNAYYGTNGPSGNPTTYHVGRIGAVDYTTLASWQGITNPQEANSVFVDPVFVNDLDLHLVSGSNPLLAGGGMPLADVVDDIDGNLRSNPPTIGGHELNVLICSVEIEDVNSENYCGFSPAGSIQIDATCNGCTLEYSINNGNTWAASPVFNGLAAGTYNVLVRDAVNPVCTETWSGNPITIVSFPEPVVTINSSNMAMCVGDTRQLTGTPVGGVFEVASGPGTIGAGDVLTATGEGVIQLFYTVTDNNGCTGLASQTITVNALPAASIAITETSGIENNDGNICLGASVTLTASGGTSYLWNDGSTTSSITIQPADDTTYSVTVTSSAGCTSVASVTIIVNPNPTAEVEPFESQICQGESITLTASGGVSYLWDTGATTESITVSPNMSTQYGVTVTDVNGCSNTAFADVTVSPAPVISNIVLGEPEDCVSEDGSIEYSVTGNSPYTFTWSTPNGAGIVQGEQNQFALTVGTYFLTVTDEEGCTAAASFTLVGPGNCGNCPLMGPLTAAPNPVCAGANTTLQVTGLTEMNPTYGVSFVYFNAPTMNPYSGGTVIATIPNNGLGGGGTTATTTTSFGTAGAYFIYTILSPVPTDPACRPSSAVTLVVNPLPVITIGITENSGNTPNDGIICQGASVTLSASGGTGYVWSTGATTSGITVAPASTTTYTVTVSDANSCTAVSSVTITVNPNPVVSITTTENSGNQPNDGNICRGSSVTLTASGGTSYLWSTGATTQAITVAPTSNTTYTVTVTNSNGCTGSNSVTIIVNIPPTVTISGATTICNGQSTTLTASGGVSYLWSTGATTQAITVAPVANTTYTVTATDANGCTGTSSVLVTVAAVPTVNPVANQTYCNGQTVPAVIFSGTPSGVVFNWTRTPAAIGLAPTAGTGNVPSFTASNTGTTPLSSTFTVTPQITVNGVTCTGNPTTFTITVNPTPVVNPVSNISTCAGLTVPAITFSGNVPGTTYNWSRTAEPIGAALSGTNTVPAFVATNPGQTAITSTFTVTPVFTNGGVSCSGQPITFTVRVEPAPTALCRNFTLNLDANGNGSISVADVNNGSFGGVITLSRTNFDCSNIGPNTVILTVTSPCNTTSTCSAIVTVRDVTPPAITCPPSINRTLDPGACCEILNWPDAVATDNCPLVSTTGNIFTTTAGNPANFFNSFAGITFDVRNETGGNLNITGFRVPVTGASVPATFNVYVTTTASTNVGNQANPAAWTLVGSFTTPGIPPTATAWNVNTFTQVNISGITLAGGQSRGVYILLANYPTGGSLRYTNGNFTATNGTMTVLSNGYGGTQVPFNNTFFPRPLSVRCNTPL
jgi:trimeric autotransporter adhesin